MGGDGEEGGGIRIAPGDGKGGMWSKRDAGMNRCCRPHASVPCACSKSSLSLRLLASHGGGLDAIVSNCPTFHLHESIILDSSEISLILIVYSKGALKSSLGAILRLPSQLNNVRRMILHLKDFCFTCGIFLFRFLFIYSPLSLLCSIHLFIFQFSVKK